MMTYQRRPILLCILVFCLCLYYMHDPQLSRRDSRRDLVDFDSKLKRGVTTEDQNRTRPLRAPINFNVEDENGRSISSISHERHNSNEPRLRTSNKLETKQPARSKSQKMSEHHNVHSNRRHSVASKHRRHNVLFIIADDMRAQISPYQGPDSEYTAPKLHTPNFEKLASQSLLFKKAFVQYTFCGPSRTSMLTSRRPDTTGIYGNDKHWRVTRGNYTSLPQYFKQNGYTVQGMGKVYHPGVSSDNDDPTSWSEPYRSAGTAEWDILKPYGPGERWVKVSPEDENKHVLPDRNAMNMAKQYLTDVADRAKSGENPFFLAFGFNKPHVSLLCPERYFDLYPIETGGFLSDARWQTPKMRTGTGIVNGTDIPDEDGYQRLPEATITQLRQAYFACISYVDDLLGELLATLEELQLMESTVISFVADHGYHLGEQDFVGKQTLYDSSSHVPMMIKIPGVTDGGMSTSTIVEALDLFPTIVEAAGLDPLKTCSQPSVDDLLCTEGKSLIPLVSDPDQKIKPYAMTQQISEDDKMTFSIRTPRYRYSMKFLRLESPDGASSYRLIDPSSPSYTEPILYDHDNDREETKNVAAMNDYKDVVVELKAAMLHSLGIEDTSR